MLSITQNSKYPTKRFQNIRLLSKNVGENNSLLFLSDKTEDSSSWRNNQRKIYQKISDINMQNQALLAISDQIKGSLLICDKFRNAPQIILQISSQIKQSFNEIVEKITQFKNDIEVKMKEIMKILSTQSFPDHQQISGKQVHQKFSDYFQNNEKKLLFQFNQKQQIDQISKKIAELELELVSTKESENKIAFMIEALEEQKSTIKKSAFKTGQKLQQKTHSQTIRQNRSISQKLDKKIEFRDEQKIINPAKTFDLKDVFINTRNLRQQRVHGIPQNNKVHLNQFVAEQAFSIVSYGNEQEGDISARGQGEQGRKIELRLLKQVEEGRGQDNRFKNNLYEHQDQEQVGDSQRKVINRPSFNPDLTIYHYNPNQSLPSTDRSTTPQPTKILNRISVKNYKQGYKLMNIEKTKTSLHNKSHRQTFLMKNLFN